MKRTSRRGVVVGAGMALAATAGCLDSTGAAGGGTTGTRSTTSDGRTTGDESSGDDVGFASRHDVDGRLVRLTSTWTSRAIVTLLAGVHPSVSADADRQYVVVELDVSGEDARSAAEDACELRVDDLVYDPVDALVKPFTEPVHLAFALPLDVDPETVSLEWVGAVETAVFPLPHPVKESIAAPAAFDVRSFDVPVRADGDEVEVSFVIENVGEGDGTFLAELGTRALSDQPEVRVPLKAGESRTVTEVVGLVPSVGDQPVVLDWGSDSLERTISVPTTTTE